MSRAKERHDTHHNHHRVVSEDLDWHLAGGNMTTKTDHTREASVSLGVRTDPGHPELGEGDRQAKPRRRRFARAAGTPVDARGARDLDLTRGDRDGVIVRHHVLARARRPDPAPYQRGDRRRRGRALRPGRLHRAGRGRQARPPPLPVASGRASRDRLAERVHRSRRGLAATNAVRGQRGGSVGRAGAREDRHGRPGGSRSATPTVCPCATPTA